MTSVVISQPMLFPWVGMFEQIRLADSYVHYDDVQFSKGSFVNRVQIWNGNTICWMTVPIKHSKLARSIKDVEIDYKRNWQRKHLALLQQSYAKSTHRNDMLEIVECVYSKNTKTVCELSITSIEEICRYFDIADPALFKRSSELGISGTATQRVFDIVKTLAGTRYITGHGAKNYLDHDLFEKHSIDVEYMDYQRKPYPQLGNQFTPFISILDLVANCGKEGNNSICSGTVNWKSFVK